MYKKNLFTCTVFIIFLSFISCQEKSSTSQKVTPPVSLARKAPDFQVDSAYLFIEKQVQFGKRVPNTQAHHLCGNYLSATFKRLGWEVIEQPFIAKAFDGTLLKSRNIIASWNPKASKRILLAAHWDSRPFADQDKERKNEPIDGANDGASGVGVLLEMARSIATQRDLPLAVGIDMILFDSEDYGQPEGTNPENYQQDTWCLGSQYWAKNKHQENYSAFYGILLDMVGGVGARFHQEGNSMKYAPSVVQTVWKTGQDLGYSNYFVSQLSDNIIDDHLYVNEVAKIPMIDIIQYDNSDGIYFNNDWHTHRDNLKIIDRQTLKAVGQTILQVLYNE